MINGFASKDVQHTQKMCVLMELDAERGLQQISNPYTSFKAL